MPQSVIKLPPDYIKINFVYADDIRIAIFTASQHPAKILIGKTRVLVHKEVFEYLNGRKLAIKLPQSLTRWPFSEIREYIAEFLLHPDLRKI